MLWHHLLAHHSVLNGAFSSFQQSGLKTRLWYWSTVPLPHPPLMWHKRKKFKFNLECQALFLHIIYQQVHITHARTPTHKHECRCRFQKNYNFEAKQDFAVSWGHLLRRRLFQSFRRTGEKTILYIYTKVDWFFWFLFTGEEKVKSHVYMASWISKGVTCINYSVMEAIKEIKNSNSL